MGSALSQEIVPATSTVQEGLPQTTMAHVLSSRLLVKSATILTSVGELQLDGLEIQMVILELKVYERITSRLVQMTQITKCGRNMELLLRLLKIVPCCAPTSTSIPILEYVQKDSSLLIGAWSAPLTQTALLIILLFLQVVCEDGRRLARSTEIFLQEIQSGLRRELHSENILTRLKITVMLQQDGKSEEKQLSIMIGNEKSLKRRILYISYIA